MYPMCGQVLFIFRFIVYGTCSLLQLAYTDHRRRKGGGGGVGGGAGPPIIWKGGPTYPLAPPPQ